MKYYRLKEINAHNYGYFKTNVIYPETACTDDGYRLTSCLHTNREDWEELPEFIFGRGYLYEEKDLV